MQWDRTVVWWALASTATVACAPPEAGPSETRAVDAIYQPFLDGKFDEFGHPFDARVIRLADDCSDFADEVTGDQWVAMGTAPGQFCDAPAEVGRGRYALNLRARARTRCAGVSCDAALLRVRVVNGDELLAEQDFGAHLFDRSGERNLSLRFVSPAASELTIQVESLHASQLQLEYAEVFRTADALVIHSPSSETTPSQLTVEYQGTEFDDLSFEVSCNGSDLTARVDELVELGLASRDAGEFRGLLRVPTEPLLADCAQPRSILVQATRGFSTRASARVTYGRSVPSCEFGAGKRILLTGFEPFPADASQANSSLEAVLAFDPQSVPGATVMKMILPVEWKTASRLVEQVAEACQPDVVVSFGQGRHQVDIETVAYNLMDASGVPGAVPDNRGAIQAGSPIIPGSEAELFTGLPAASLVEALQAAGHEAGISDDPGRYICNNLFYDLAHNVAPHVDKIGFVHLPIESVVDEEERAALADIVRIVVQGSL